MVPCLSEELVASFPTSSSQVEAPSTAASLRRVALAWVPSLAASPTWQLFSLLSKTASFLIGFYDRNSLIVILFLKSISKQIQCCIGEPALYAASARYRKPSYGGASFA